MAGKRIKIWIRGSIVEPVVAIVILVTTFAMAFSVLSRVNIVPSIMAINKADEMINEEVFLVYTEKDYLDKEETDGAFTLFKKVEQINNLAIKVHMEVYDASKKLISQRTVQIYDIEFKNKGLSTGNEE